MSIFWCIELTGLYTEAANSPGVRSAIPTQHPDRAAIAHTLVREQLDGDSQELFDAESAGFPPAIWNAIGDMVSSAAKADIDFQFASVPPESRMEYARKRRMRFTFDVEEDGVKVVLQHTLRHPTWLPEVVLPTREAPVEAQPETVGTPA